jgi:hypothetical protein
MTKEIPSFPAFWWRVVATHILTYFVVGLSALVILDYRHLYSETELRHLMRPTTSPWVAAGPGLQFLRGTLFALVLWPLLQVLMNHPRGWLVLFGLCIGFAILGTAGPAPGSIEGVLFTTLPTWIHLLSLPEVVLQMAAFSILLLNWCQNPVRWKNVTAIVGVVLVLLMSFMGVLSALAPHPS